MRLQHIKSGKNVVFNKVNIATGQVLKSTHLITYSHHSYIGFVYGQLTDCVFTGANAFTQVPNLTSDPALEIGLQPNPSRETIYLTNLKTNLKCEVMDNLGRLIFEGSVSPTNNSLNISTLQEGLYYLKLTDKEYQTKTFKLVKQN
jgi:hypothetical protein